MKSSHYITQCTHRHTHIESRTDNQLAAANPEIKASVTDVISGCICGREKESRTNTCRATNIHGKMLVERKKKEVERGREKNKEEKARTICWVHTEWAFRGSKGMLIPYKT